MKNFSRRPSHFKHKAFTPKKMKVKDSKDLEDGFIVTKKSNGYFVQDETLNTKQYIAHAKTKKEALLEAHTFRKQQQARNDPPARKSYSVGTKVTIIEGRDKGKTGTIIPHNLTNFEKGQAQGNGDYNFRPQDIQVKLDDGKITQESKNNVKNNPPMSSHEKLHEQQYEKQRKEGERFEVKKTLTFKGKKHYAVFEKFPHNKEKEGYATERRVTGNYEDKEKAEQKRREVLARMNHEQNKKNLFTNITDEELDEKAEATFTNKQKKAYDEYKKEGFKKKTAFELAEDKQRPPRKTNGLTQEEYFNEKERGEETGGNMVKVVRSPNYDENYNNLTEEEKGNLIKVKKQYGYDNIGKAVKKTYELRKEKEQKEHDELMNKLKEREEHKEQVLKGGIGDNTNPDTLNQAELRKGMAVEREHTTNKAIQKEIATDHLTEDPKYYQKLAKMEANKSQNYELQARYDTRKDFYGKAQVRTEGNKKILRSYNTDVAYIENGKAHINGLYSQTTTRHIKEFLRQEGYKAENSKQIKKDYFD